MDIQKQATALSPRHPLTGERVRRIPRFSNDVLRINKEKRIGTWNVQSMYQAGKAANIVKEVKRLQIDILGCSETRRPDSGHCTIDEHHIYFSGNHTTRNRNGVAIILNKQTNEAVKGFIPISSRVALIKIKSKPFDLNIIQSYAPTTESSEQEMEEFYEQLRTALKHTRREEVNMMLGDMNAMVGQGKFEVVVGEFGLGVRNERGERLIEFCEEMNFTIMNTFFKLPSRRLYTWKSPANSSHRIIRNQIDFIMINRRYRNAVVSCKTYPGADIPSDHNLLLARTKLRLKKIVKKRHSRRINVRKLQQENILQRTRDKINNELGNISQTSNHATEIEDLWNRIKTSIVSVTEEELRQDKQARNRNGVAIILNKQNRRRDRNG
ncbi:craniofacial development protein 2-like [Cylas formicarius]|uniref:craniofacial development protein 2-like n=1 Tax=Cylas formicarius TaxID=197179 RepID=UPI002958AC91|nr:craniofacial development protein 2-like [Cylas formicarius]